MFEWSNIATSSPLDGAGSGNHATSASITSGSQTTAVNGDLIIQWSYIDGVLGASNSPTSFTKGSTNGNTTPSLLETDLCQANGAQYGVQSTAGAVNLTLTQNTSAPFISVTMALKSGTSGGAHTGINVFGEQDCDLGAQGLANGATSDALQMPTSGNLLVVNWEGDTTTAGITSIASSPANTWTKRQDTGQANGHVVQFFSADNATTANNQTITLTIPARGSTHNETVHMYDIAGAATSAWDSTACSSLTACSNGATSVANHNDITSPTITPSTSNGLVFGLLGVDGGTVASLTSSQSFNSCTFDGEIGSDVPCDRNNGYAHFYNPNTTGVAFVWHAGDTTNWNGYGFAGAVFKAPTLSKPANQFPRTQ